VAEEKRSMWKNKWLYVVIVTLVIFGATFFAGMWFAGRGARSVSTVVDSYTNVYAGSDSTKDVADLVPLYASNSTLQDVAADRAYEGTAAIKTALDSLLATPEFNLSVEYTLIGGDSAVVGWTANGTAVGTNRLAQVSGVTVLQISEGKIARETWYYDPAKAPF